MRKRPDRLTDEQVHVIQKAVWQRDQGRCLIDGQAGGEVHELLQRSSSRPNSSRVFRLKFMAVVCAQHHTELHHTGQKTTINRLLFKVLRRRYNYRYTQSEVQMFSKK